MDHKKESENWFEFMRNGLSPSEQEAADRLRMSWKTKKGFDNTLTPRDRLPFNNSE